MNQSVRKAEKLVACAKSGKPRTSLSQWYAEERISARFSKDDRVRYVTTTSSEKWSCSTCSTYNTHLIATFRLHYEDDYEHEFSVLSTRFRFGGRKFSKCACSELKTRTRSRPRTPIWRSLITCAAHAQHVASLRFDAVCKTETWSF